MTRANRGLSIVLLVGIWGCAGQPAPVASPSGSPSTSFVSPTPAISPVPSASVGSPGANPEPSADSPGPLFAQDAIVDVVTHDLRVRSLPEVSDASKKLEPLLDAPGRVFIVDGPVEASGYTWYEVAPIGDADTTVELPFGWVAAADKDGTAWLAKTAVDCPAPPTSVDELWVLSGLVGLGCFGGSEIGIEARLAQPEATCGVDIGWTVEPEWLGGTCPQPTFLVESTTTIGLPLNATLDPDVDVAAFKPGVEPADWIDVRITGRYDHPDSEACHGVSHENPVPYVPEQTVLGCRATFAITAIAMR